MRSTRPIYGYLRVEYDEDEERKMSETHHAAWLNALGPDFRLNDSDSEDEGPCVARVV